MGVLVIRTVIFDMDGVLIDSEPLHYEAFREVFGAAGVDLSEDVYRSVIGRTLPDTIEILKSRFGLGADSTAIAAAYSDAVLEVLSRPLTPGDGAHWLIDQLRERGFGLGLASSSRRSWIEATLRGLELTHAFEAIVSGDDVGYGKPAPDIYLAAARLLDADPTRCLAIEDSPAGLQSARAAGMTTVGLITPHIDPALLGDANHLIASLRDFPVDLLEAPTTGAT